MFQKSKPDKMLRNSFALKTISLSLVFLILGEIIYPTVAMAMVTSGETQPDIYGYSPAESSENVSLSSGGFNYTIPITSVPEYPMGISYRSGMKQDDEAGAFGFGFSGFSGAIARTAIGLPDDLAGGERVYDFDNQANWAADAGVSLGYSIGSAGGASVGLTLGYDNYIGCYVSLSVSVGIGFSKGGVGGGVGLSLVSDSRQDKVGIGMGASLGPSLGGDGLGARTINQNMSILSVHASNINGFGADVAGVSISDFKNSGPAASSICMPPLSSVSPTARGWGVSLSVPITPVVSISGSYKYNASDDRKPKKSYGCMYLSHSDRAQEGNGILTDFAIEGENSNDNAQLANPVHMQKDYFSVNASGISGNMQLYQDHYGVFSRNRSRTQYRDIGLMGVNSTRDEVFPWTEINQSTFNKEIDILQFFKKKKSKDDTNRDFDKIFFKEVPVANIKEDPYLFKSSTFKMKGDLAGQFTMVSENVGDNSFLSLSLEKVSSSAKGKLAFLTYEKQRPLYKPNVSASSFKNDQIETSTTITKYTVEEVLKKYNNNKGLDFSKSIYSHYKYDKSAGASDNSLNNHLQEQNIFTKLSGLSSSRDYLKKQIAWIEMQKSDGMRYIFNLPVFANESESRQLIGSGEIPPVIHGNTYKTTHSYNRGQAVVSNNFKYPYAWLLTAVVGPDYVDYDNIPGPSEGDLGYWVKFKYTETASDYNWRSPYAGLNHMPGAIEKSDDDSYSMQQGSKEVYVLSEIESSEYLTKYDYQKRQDGIDAPSSIVNGKAINVLKNNTSFALTQGTRGDDAQFHVNRIDLFKKHFKGNNSEPVSKTQFPNGKRIQSTHFEYDYSICPNTPNSVASGKLTLKKVYNKAYDDVGNEMSLPAYKFNYWGETDAKYNPSYDDRAVDRWGNYSVNAKRSGSNGVDYYNAYCEYDERIADENAKVYQLKSVRLPSGGVLEVEYKARSYGYVRKSTPYIMRRIKPSADKVNITEVNVDYELISFDVDVSDIYYDLLSKSAQTHLERPLDVSEKELDGYPDGKKLLNVDDYIFGEIAFYQQPNSYPDPYPSESQLHIDTCTAKIALIGNVIIQNDPITGRPTAYQKVTLKALKNTSDDDTPFIKGCKSYMYNESLQMRAIKESLKGCKGIDDIISRYEKMETVEPLEAVGKMISNVRNAFTTKSSKNGQLDECFGTPGSKFFAGLSFIRTPIYKGKYTGSRVHSLIYKDNFVYGKDVSLDKGNTYGTIYYFDEKSDGNGRSAGVATIEPGGGYATVIDMYSPWMKGIGYAPSPAIYSAKTAIVPLYANAKDSGIGSRKKGKTVYEFYTPKDEGLGISDSYKQSNLIRQPGGTARGYYFMMMAMAYLKFKIFGKQIKIPFPMPLNLKWSVNDQYSIKEYQYTDYSDIYGSPKSILQYEEGSKNHLAKQYYEYFKPNEAITTYKGGFETSNLVSDNRPGMMEQVWAESYYKQSSKMNFIPWLLYYGATTHRKYVYTNMQYKYVPPIVKAVTTTVDGLEVVSENTAFDYYTGTPVEVKSKDSYRQTKIKRIVPAYWKYTTMGPSSVNTRYENNLTAITGEYLYLNTVDNNHILSANVTTWDKMNWTVADYLQPRRVDTATEYRYLYTKRSGSEIKAAYDNGATNDSRLSRSAIGVHRSSQQFTYDVNINKDGTFSSFTPFNYSGANVNAWKKVLTNEMYDANGTLLQSRDILDKFVSQHMGYNFSNAISVVANASYSQSAYDGAENTYLSETGDTTYLEADKVQLRDASVLQTSKTNNSTKIDPIYATYLMANPTKAIQIIKPAVAKPGTVIGKATVEYKSGSKRVISIKVKDSENYFISSNLGESFEGFIKVRGINASTDLLVLDWNNINSITYSPVNTVDYQSSYRTDVHIGIESCDLLLPYRMPTGLNVLQAHTGDFVFALSSGKVGTEVILPVQQPQQVRKFKSMVWVSNQSPKSTLLVLQFVNSSGTVIREVSTSLAQPYTVAGNWSLLRTNLELTDTELSYSNTKVIAFVKNLSESGMAIYDDFRVLPYDAEMSNKVFDHQFSRLTSTLDADHFASYYSYDTRGRAVESTVEVQGVGRKVINKMRYNDQVKPAND